MISERGRLSLWDAESGLQLGEELVEEHGLGDCGFSPDGTRILVNVPSERGGCPRLFDSSNFSQAAVLEGHLESVNVLRFSPDSRLVATGSDDGTLRLWSAQAGEILATLWGHTAKVTACAFSPDSRRLVSASWDDTLMVWDVPAGVESHYGHVYSIGTSALSPDGNWLGAGQDDGTVSLTRLAAPGETRRLGRHAKPLFKSAFSPDGRLFVTGSRDGQIRGWSVSGAEVFTCDGRQRAISGLAFTPNGGDLISCSWDGTVRLWDPLTGKQRTRIEAHEQDVNCMALSSDGRRLVTGSDGGTLKVWSLPEGVELAVLEGHMDDVHDCEFSPDGALVLSVSRGLGLEGGYSAVKLWDAATGKELRNLGGHKEFGYRCAFSPDGCWMASGGGDGACRLWDARGNGVLVLPGPTLYGFSPDSRLLACGREGKIGVWSVPDGAEVASYYSSAGRLIAYWHPDSRRMILADDAGCIHILQLEDLARSPAP